MILVGWVSFGQQEDIELSFGAYEGHNEKTPYSYYKI